MGLIVISVSNHSGFLVWANFIVYHISKLTSFQKEYLIERKVSK